MRALTAIVAAGELFCSLECRWVFDLLGDEIEEGYQPLGTVLGMPAQWCVLHDKRGDPAFCRLKLKAAYDLMRSKFTLGQVNDEGGKLDTLRSIVHSEVHPDFGVDHTGMYAAAIRFRNKVRLPQPLPLT